MRNNATRFAFLLAFVIIFSLFVGLVLLSFSQELDRVLEPAPNDLPYSAFAGPLLRALEAFHHPGFARAMGSPRLGLPDLSGTFARLIVEQGSEVEQTTRRIGYAALLAHGYSRKTLAAFCLNRAFVGSVNGSPIQGFAEAARVYFGIAHDRLNLGEALLLCHLALSPQNAPRLSDPDPALRARNRLLSLMNRAGLIADSEYEVEVTRPYSPPPDHRPVE